MILAKDWVLQCASPFSTVLPGAERIHPAVLSLCWLHCPGHADSWIVAILSSFHIKRSKILVATETSSPNYKEFDSVDVKSYSSSFFFLVEKKEKRKETRHEMITQWLVWGSSQVFSRNTQNNTTWPLWQRAGLGSAIPSLAAHYLCSATAAFRQPAQNESQSSYSAWFAGFCQCHLQSKGIGGNNLPGLGTAQGFGKASQHLWVQEELSVNSPIEQLLGLELSSVKCFARSAGIC